MDSLLDAVAALVFRVSSEKVRAIASRIRRTQKDRADSTLVGVVGTPIAAELIDKLISTWRLTTVSADELASMLLAASHTFSKTANQQTMELVWTGPTTPFVSTRRTEQALLQVVNAAERSLFITSFVAYDVSSIVQALNAASERGVAISILLERSKDQGGSVTFDVISKMKTMVPNARIYAWIAKVDPFVGGCVHAKVAVADGTICFVTSANLTGHAMDKNMEAGLLVSGGDTPRQLEDHLRSLTDAKVISRV
ncbi:MAG: phospholipase [Acidovorax sp. SCN 65-108]|nr:MAG: phospholipase [Acidovorax sp. SCN 65-108]OJV70894.1 MAG: phospholipase [Burkholderiales bacterium 64-34]